MRMNYFELRKTQAEQLDRAEALLDRAKAEKREMTPEESKLFDEHTETAKQLRGKIEESVNRNTIFKAFGFNPLAVTDAGRPQLDNAVEVVKPDMSRFQAEFFDFVNRALGTPWQPKLSASDVPLYIGTGTGVESVGFTVPVEVLPYLPAYYNLNSFQLAGARIIETDNTVPLKLPILSAGPAADTFDEGAAPTESHPFALDGFTFNGTKYARLVKASYESLMNSALPLQGSIQDELLSSLATTLTGAITTAMLTALTANSGVLVTQGTNDIYKTLGSLVHAIPPRFEMPSNKFMLSRSTLAKIKDQRATTSGVPLFDATSQTILGKPWVINDNLTSGQVVYGSWQDGCIIRRTPVIVAVFLEKYAEQGEVGFRVMQWNDQHFLCETAAPNQPLYYTVLS